MRMCVLCNRFFGSDEALEQHVQDSPAHVPSYNCDMCNRSFRSENALEQHIESSPAHAPTYDCERCNKSFRSETALEQHIQNSPVHASYCETCDRSFRSEDALNQHIQNSSAHVLPSDTPLDSFFQSFSIFPYNRGLPPAESYKRLRIFYDWRRDDPESRESWRRYQDALREELKVWFGSEDDLGSWHSLCRAIKIEPLPKNCQACEKAVRGKYVNIVDLVQWARDGGTGKDVRIFQNLDALREYTKRTQKFFSRGSDEGKGVLRHLLRFIR